MGLSADNNPRHTRTHSQEVLKVLLNGGVPHLQVQGHLAGRHLMRTAQTCTYLQPVSLLVLVNVVHEQRHVAELHLRVVEVEVSAPHGLNVNTTRHTRSGDAHRERTRT